MVRLIVLLLGLTVALPGNATESSIARWLGVVVSYDPHVWRVSQPDGDHGRGIDFTCVGPACPGEPSVSGWAEPLGWAATAANACAADAARPEMRSVSDPVVSAAMGPLRFTVLSGWSGCRARDNAIYDACAVDRGIVYRIVDGVGGGCHLGPRVPEDLLLQLLDGIRPAASAP